MKPYLIFFLSWIFPGAGHFVQRKYIKAIVFFSGIALLILLGLVMEGRFFQAYTEITNSFGVLQKQYHPLLILGFLGDIGSGVFYFIVKFLGFGGGNIEAVTFHYGTTYLVSAGLINYLVALNAFDIARGKKK